MKIEKKKKAGHCDNQMTNLAEAEKSTLFLSSGEGFKLDFKG